MKNHLTIVERILRGICFLWHLSLVCFFLMVEYPLRPLWPKLNEKVGGYFRRNFKLRELHEYILQFFGLGTLWVFGIHCITQYETDMPKDYNENVILMLTHGSNLDPPLILATWPYYAHFVAKKSLFKIPVVGFLMKCVGQIPIDRENLKDAIGSLNSACLLSVEEHKTIAIAPEGTRRRSPSIGPEQLLPFKKGPFHMAKSSSTDIVPVVIIGANRVWRPGQPIPTPGTVIVKYLKRIPKEYVARVSIEELQEEVKKRFQLALEKVPDEIIHNTEQKPFIYFFFLLITLYLTMSFLMKLIL